MDFRGELQLALGDTYKLGRELGGGGMSRVFIAEDTKLARAVVVKVLAPELVAAISAERLTTASWLFWLTLSIRLKHT